MLLSCLIRASCSLLADTPVGCFDCGPGETHPVGGGGSMGTTPGPDWGFFLPTPRSLVVRAGAGYFAGNQIGGHARIQATGPCLLAPTCAGAAPAYRPKGGVCLGLRPVQRP